MSKETRMKSQPVLEEHYGANVWTNKDTDSIRRAECLCYSCKLLDFERPDSENCPIAGTLYHFCRTTNLALMVTRCPAFAPKKFVPKKKTKK